MTAPANTSQLVWVDAIDEAAVRASGAIIVDFDEVCTYAAKLRRQPREGLADPLHPLIHPLTVAQALAVKNVTLDSLQDLCDLYEVILRPVLTAGVPLLIGCPVRLEDLRDDLFVEDLYQHPHTLERARWLVALGLAGSAATHPAEPEIPGNGLDPEQTAAANAAGGVLQIIAPAGSGKTSTLVARVATLLRRGVAPQRLLVCTFNRDAKLELDQRMRAAGLPVKAMTFHGLGRSLLAEEFGALELLSQGFTVPQWQRFAAMVAREHQLDVPDAASLPGAIQDLKLGRLQTPAEAQRAARDQTEEAVARVYELVERENADRGRYLFDDMIFRAVRRLREDHVFRAQAQCRYDAVLLDEGQDVEPAQEILVRVLAAPQDELTVVGDEDQTLYGWRRASVDSMLSFDVAYPGLQRVALATNYRCDRAQITAADKLIRHNRARFPKVINAPESRPPAGPNAVRVAALGEEGACGLLPRRLAGHSRGTIAVLARTVNALRPYALAAAGGGLRITGPAELFESSGALRTVEAYTAVFAHPTSAQQEDVAIVLRRPGRGLSDDSFAAALTQALHSGLPLVDAIGTLNVAASQRWRLDRARQSFGTIARATDAQAFIAAIRRDGLDDHYEQAAEASAAVDSSQLDLLARCQDEAKGHTLQSYQALLASRADLLRRSRDDVAGIELTTVHRAKGREWPTVVLVGADEGVLPHHSAVEDDDPKTQEGLEGERRVMYVAMTRATQELSILHEPGKHSRFLFEAGLVKTMPQTLAGGDQPKRKPAAPARNGAGPRRGDGFWTAPATAPAVVAQPAVIAPPADEVAGDVARVLERAFSDGLKVAFGEIADGDLALRTLLHVLSHPSPLAANGRTASGSLVVAIRAMHALRGPERAAVLAVAGSKGVTTRPLATLTARDAAAIRTALRNATLPRSSVDG